MDKLKSWAKHKYVQSLLLALVAGMVFRLTTASKYTSESEYLDAFMENYQVYAIPLPEEISFAGEKAPMFDFEVRERIDREILVNTYYQSQTLIFFKKANRWFPVIEKILKEEGVPEDFKYLAIIESGLSNVISPAGAVGFWQFMKNTAIEYGLEVNDEVDERYDPVKSTYAATRYLKKAYAEFGSWSLVAAAYNMGLTGLRNQVRLQGVDDYHGLYLNTETSRYLPRLVAVKTIMEDPRKFGYNFREKHLYKPLKTNAVYVDTAITDLVAFAKSQGIVYKHLKVFNPWLRKTYLPNKTGKRYKIEIPDPSVFTVENEIKPEYMITQPEVVAIEKKTTDQAYINIKHTVKKGEDIRSIAAMFDLKVVDIVLWNKMESTDLVKGQQLEIHIPKPLGETAVEQ